MSENLPAIGPNGVILYDGDCGICSRLANSWSPTVMAHGYSVGKLQDRWVGPEFRLSTDELLHDIRLLRPDRTTAAGGDVYLDVARHIWWAWPFYAIFHLPGFKQIVHGAYRWFADNRHRISSACGIKAGAVKQ